MTRIIGICSGKGGVGKTTIATNLGLALKKFGMNTIVIDCNLSTPHLSQYFGIKDVDGTLNDVLIGRKEITSVLYRYENILFIPASLDLNNLIDVDIGKLKKHIQKLTKTEMIDFIILDSAPGLGREAVTVLDVADELIFVTLPFVPMISDVLRCKEITKEIDKNKNMSIVLNMITKAKHEIPKKTVEEITDLPVIAELNFDKNIIHSLVRRSPVLSYNPYSQSSIGIMQLAAKITKMSYKPPLRFKINKFISKIKNSVSPGKVFAPYAKEIKEELFIQ